MSTVPKTPWHLWVVGIIALLWNSIGALDFVMTQTRNAAYMAEFTSAQLDFFSSFPWWVNASWALGVWGGVLGAVLLLLRSRFAVPVFALSLLGLIITTFHNFVLAKPNMAQLVGDFEVAFTGVIFLIAILLFWYARVMRQKGVLR